MSIIAPRHGEAIVTDPAIWLEWIKVAALICGICFGAFAVASPSWVWLRQQIFSAGAGLLAILGTVLMGAPVWSIITVSGFGVSGEFKHAIMQLQSTTEELSRTQSSLRSTAALAMESGRIKNAGLAAALGGLQSTDRAIAAIQEIINAPGDLPSTETQVNVRRLQVVLDELQKERRELTQEMREVPSLRRVLLNEDPAG